MVMTRADAGPFPITGTDLQDRILYRDALMLIIDKPPGLPVHAGPGRGRSLEDLFDALRFGLPNPPALAHRLDRDTSGCLVLGRHRRALRRLGGLFAEGKVEKIYWAVVEGRPAAAAGRVEHPLKKITQKAGWRMVVAADGQKAITDYRIIGEGAGRSWIEFRPRTGRTHQIRVHAAMLGCPLVGEPIYGGAPPDACVPLHLHAREISVPLYEGKPIVTAVASPPAHMTAALASCGYVVSP